MTVFPISLEPDHFEITELPDYGKIINENEIGRELRRTTETTGFHTRILIKYNYLTAADVGTLLGFYQSVKGLYGAFTLPSNFYLNPEAYNLELNGLGDTTEWRFEEPPTIETYQNDIYTTEIKLISLKEEISLNVDTFYGFLESAKLKLNLSKATGLLEDFQDIDNSFNFLTMTASNLSWGSYSTYEPVSLNLTPESLALSQTRGIVDISVNFVLPELYPLERLGLIDTANLGFSAGSPTFTEVDYAHIESIPPIQTTVPNVNVGVAGILEITGATLGLQVSTEESSAVEAEIRTSIGSTLSLQVSTEESSAVEAEIRTSIGSTLSLASNSPQLLVTPLLAVDNLNLSFTSSDTLLTRFKIVSPVNLTNVAPNVTWTRYGERSIELAVLRYNPNSIGFYHTTSGMGLNVETKTSDFTTYANCIFLVDTNLGLVNATLHSNPNSGDIVIFADKNGSNILTPATGFGLYNLRIVPGAGHTIQGESEILLDKDNSSIQLVFENNKWSIFGTII